MRELTNSEIKAINGGPLGLVIKAAKAAKKAWKAHKAKAAAAAAGAEAGYEVGKAIGGSGND